MLPTSPAPSLAVSPGCSAQGLRSRGMGVMFLAFFGSWWLYLGASALAAPSLVFPAVALLGGALFLAGLSLSRRSGFAIPAGDAAVLARRSLVFRNINIVQWSAIIVLMLVLNLTHHVEWITPGIMLIVGLHFFPLASLFGTVGHVLIGGALCAVAVGYPLLSAQGPLSPSGPIAAGLILWSAALAWAVRPR